MPLFQLVWHSDQGDGFVVWRSQAKKLVHSCHEIILSLVDPNLIPSGQPSFSGDFYVSNQFPVFFLFSGSPVTTIGTVVISTTLE